MKSSLLNNWTDKEFNALEEGVLLAGHRLGESGLFNDEALIEILDTHPEEFLTISTMGQSSDVFEWAEGYRNGVSASELLRLVKEGHLWMNVRRLMDFQAKHRDLIHELYDELQGGKPGFQAIQRTANLLISSPTALVHYHVDLPVNMLWHIRGRKRVWVYPHFDHRFVSKQVMEMVAVGELTEDVPYSAELDNYALQYDVQPGQLLTWPQHAPHRVENLDGMNVSLSTEHKNARAIRRNNMYEANYFLRKHFGFSNPSTDVEAWHAYAKQALARGVRLGNKFTSKQTESFTYSKSFEVDPNEPNGVRWLNVESQAAPHEALEALIA